MTVRISKSALKRRYKQEEEGAGELALLSDRDLRNLPVDEAVKEEVRRCRGLKGGARKRQIKYLARLMREGSVDEVFDFLARKKGSRLKDNVLHKEVERLRDIIVNEALAEQQRCLQAGETWGLDWRGGDIDDVLQRINPDEGELRRAVYNYVQNRGHNHFREIFRIIKSACERMEINEKMIHPANR